MAFGCLRGVLRYGFEKVVKHWMALDGFAYGILSTDSSPGRVRQLYTMIIAICCVKGANALPAQVC